MKEKREVEAIVNREGTSCCGTHALLQPHFPFHAAILMCDCMERKEDYVHACMSGEEGTMI